MTAFTTYADLWRPQTRSRAIGYDVLLVIGGSLLVALAAQISIPIPFDPVPITGQTFGVLLVGALLGSRRGGLALLAYMLEGIGGLPFFAGGTGGVARLAGPTGGYIIGFIVAAYVVGWLSERGFDRKVWTTLVMMSIGEAVIYLFGVPWLSAFVGWGKALPLGLYPFIPGAAIKIALAALTLPLGWKLIGRRGE